MKLKIDTRIKKGGVWYRVFQVWIDTELSVDDAVVLQAIETYGPGGIDRVRGALLVAKLSALRDWAAFGEIEVLER